MPLEIDQIEPRVHELGQQIFRRRGTYFFKKNFWYQKLIELATQDQRVKINLFRFVDVLPVLQTAEQKKAHLLEYLSAPSGAQSWPMSLRLVTQLLKVPGFDRFVVAMSDLQVKKMATNFIVGENLAQVLPVLLDRRSRGIGFTLDILGEFVLSDEEAEFYQQKYLSLIEELGAAQKTWARSPQLDETALGPIPPVNISIKISALDCRMDSLAFDVSLARLTQRLLPLLEAAVRHQVFINFDLEQFALKDLTRELFKRLILRPEFRSYRYFGIVVQAYLKSSSDDVKDWIDVARRRGTPFTIRLVKGAYWDSEVITADQNGWEPPVYLKKIESDQNYELCSRLLLDAFPAIELALGSHNVRSIAHALAYAEALGLPRNALEVQMLFGMADPFKESLADMKVRVREYDPMGEMLPGLSYLVRRLLENSSNDSFLKQSFLNKTGIHDLLRSPQK